MITPMYTMTTPHAPRGYTMRPRLYAIGRKVNSLLSELSLSTCETWLLPQTCVMCMTKNQEGYHEQDGEYTKQGAARNLQLSDVRQPPDDRSIPDVRRLESTAVG